jgi:hypothetical protein
MNDSHRVPLDYWFTFAMVFCILSNPTIKIMLLRVDNQDGSLLRESSPS